MTREEAIEMFLENVCKLPLETIPITELVHRIYDDIENRTCVNCRFCNFDVENKQTFSKGYCSELLCPVHLNFGCNKFEEETNV